METDRERNTTSLGLSRRVFPLSIPKTRKLTYEKSVNEKYTKLVAKNLIVTIFLQDSRGQYDRLHRNYDTSYFCDYHYFPVGSEFRFGFVGFG